MTYKVSEFNYDGRRMGYGWDILNSKGVVVARFFDKDAAELCRYAPELGQIALHITEFFGAIEATGCIKGAISSLPEPAMAELFRAGYYLTVIAEEESCDEPKCQDPSSPETSAECGKRPCCETAVCTLEPSASPPRKKRGRPSKKTASSPPTSDTGCQS